MANGASGGFTLLESSIAIAILCIVSSAAVLAARSGSTSFQDANRNSHLETRVQRTLDRVAFELITAIEADFQPMPVTAFGTSDLLFRHAVGFALGAVVPGPFQRLVSRLEAGEADDGVDNDGDGLVDEHQLVYIRDDGGLAEKSVTLCIGVAELLEGELPNGLDDNGNGLVDEAGFCAQLEGGVLVLRLSLQAASASGVLTRTLQTGIGIRN